MKTAAIYCSERGGKLFEPKSEKQNKIVTGLAQKRGISGFWIGIHDKNFEGNFVSHISQL